MRRWAIDQYVGTALFADPDSGQHTPYIAQGVRIDDSGRFSKGMNISLMEDGHPVCPLRRQGEVMQHHHDNAALISQTAHYLHDLPLVSKVQRADRLIE